MSVSVTKWYWLPACDGTGCEFKSWHYRIYILCSLSLRLLGSLRGSLGTNGLTQKLCLKKHVTCLALYRNISLGLHSTATCDVK